jgi:arylsulfatase A-like enzyme
MYRAPSPLLALALTGLAACSPPGDDDRPANVILISVDTLRADHLGCYGYSRPTTPRIDAICSEGVAFEQAIAHAPSTLPSHASILTSLIPQHHRASFDNRRALPEEITTLAEVLVGQGYRTAAFTGGGQIDAVFGLGQGFEQYSVPASNDFETTVSAGLDWLDGLGGRPFFLFLHTYQVHNPYDPSPEVLSLFETDYEGELPATISVELIDGINKRSEALPAADLAHIIATYDAEIREVDTAFGRLIDTLAERGLLDSTLVVFTSDHGEEFGEHGYVGWHSHTTYEELLHVPLFFKFPAGGFSHRRIDRMVRSIDIAPTILKAIGSRVPESFSGLDLAAFLGERQVPPLVAIGRLDRADEARVSFIRDDRFKLERVGSRRQRLFDLIDDPLEQWDTSDNYPEALSRLLTTYQTLIASRATAADSEVETNEQLREQLKALGYIQ